jgi:hypothetical protein
MLSVTMLNVVMLSVVMLCHKQAFYAKSCFAECRYAKCCHAECRSAILYIFFVGKNVAVAHATISDLLLLQNSQLKLFLKCSGGVVVKGPG